MKRNLRRSLLTPWGAASRIYGPFGLPDGDLAALGGNVLSRLGPVLEALLTARAWLTLNGAALLVQLFVDGVDDVATSVFQGGAVTMVVGPFGLLLAAGVLVAAARGAGRRAASRQLLRPVLIAAATLVLSVGIFGLQLPGVRQELAALIDPIADLGRRFLPLSGLLGLWLLTFGLCAVYLIHRHGFRAAGGGRLLEPLVSVWLAWTVAAVEIAMYEPADLTAGTFVTLTIAGATAATLISVAELVALHRRGITFRRGPWLT